VSIPYTRLYGIGALPKVLRQEVGRQKFLALLNETNFSEENFHVRGKVVPHASVLKLFNAADMLLARPQQKIAVSSGMTASDYGPWAAYALAGTNVEELISRAGKTVYLHQNFGRLSLELAGDNVKWSYWVEGFAPVPLHIEHAILPMVEAIRSYCGKGWKPVRIELQYRDRRRQIMLEDYFQVPVWMNGSVNSIVFPAEDLARKRDVTLPQGPLPNLELLKHTRRDVANATCEAVMSAVEGNIFRHRFDLGSLAETLGMSTRSLQRELNSQGTTYRRILEETRMQEARRLLAHGTINLTETAVQLGYSDLPHFTRAFKRRFDMPPSAYAELIRNSLNIAGK
jgi:AraC-like DNA-binding protein